MNTLHTGDTVTIAHHDPIHGRFEVQAEVVLPVYDSNGDLERVHVAVGGRSAVVQPCQLVEVPQR